MHNPYRQFHLFVGILAGLLALSATPVRANEISAPPGPEVLIPGTHTRSLHSSVVGQDYELQISLPRGYADSDQRYGVVYVLDAQWDFPLVYSIYGEQYYDGFLPGLIIVGVLWGGKSPDPDVSRLRDFTPTDADGKGESGGAANFLAFFERELIPFVDRQYRTSGNRTLMGSSLGGLFTLYTLFNRPDLFDNFIPTSPATPWDGGVLYDSTEGFAERSAASPSRLFVAVGELEDLYEPFKTLVEILKARDFPGLTWRSHVVSNAGHSGVKPEGNSRGLQFAYQRPDLKLAAEELEPLLGLYRSADGSTTVEVFVRGNRVWARIPTTGEEWEFRAQDRLHFYHPGQFINVRFLPDEAGEVSGFVVETFDSVQEFKRIEAARQSPAGQRPAA